MKSSLFKFEKKAVKNFLIAGMVAAASCFSLAALTGNSALLSKIAEPSSITASAVDVLIIADTSKDNQNKTLQNGKFYVSPNQKYVAVYQNDGNLVVYHFNSVTKKAHTPIWSSGTNGNPGSRCVMQADGNLVIYNANNKAIWHTHTNGKRRAMLGLADDGELYVYSFDQKRDTWSNNRHETVVTTVTRQTTMPPQRTTLSTAGTKPGSKTTSTTTVTTVPKLRFEQANAAYPFGKLAYGNNTYQIWPETLDSSWKKTGSISRNVRGIDLTNIASYELIDGGKFASLIANASDMYYAAADNYFITIEFYRKDNSYRALIKADDSGTSRMLKSMLVERHTVNGHEIRIVSKHQSLFQWYLWIDPKGQWKMSFATLDGDYHRYKGVDYTYTRGGYFPPITPGSVTITSAVNSSMFKSLDIFPGYVKVLKKF